MPPTTIPMTPEEKHSKWLTAAYEGELPQVWSHELVLMKPESGPQAIVLYSLNEADECVAVGQFAARELRSLVDTLAEALRCLESDA